MLWIENLLGAASDRRIVAILLALGSAFFVWMYGPVIGLTIGRMQWLAFAIIALTLIAFLVGDWWLHRRAVERVDDLFETQSNDAVINAAPDKRGELEVLRKRMDEAVSTIKQSKLGKLTGRAALYELPWYMVIGNPAAGKSSAIINSGLNFPLNDQRDKIIQGIGGTRNCDWFFSSEGILIDTAGRYTSYEEDNAEWLGFLKLLRQHRPRVPINGIIVVASVTEINQASTEQIDAIAGNLRKRVQEIVDQLGVFVPIYVLFTKMDLIAGFQGFFDGLTNDERKQVWGTTLAFQKDTQSGTEATELFSEHFEVLQHGLESTGLRNLELQRGDAKASDLISFPLEFAGLLLPLKRFVSQLFQDNPYQFKPIFRGFYFSSALQEGMVSSHLTDLIVDRFNLKGTARATQAVPKAGQNSYFLTNLFSKVILRDHQLVRQYNSPARARARLMGFGAGLAALALLVGLWSWSYTNNRSFIQHIQKDMSQVVKLQDQKTDLASRMDAMIAIQNRLKQLQTYREDTPLNLSLGLYQGDKVEDQLRAEYFKGLDQVLLKPVSKQLELTLQGPVPTQTASSAAASATAANSTPNARAAALSAANSTGIQTSEDYYNALKTYLMLGQPQNREPSFLNTQLPIHWRTWLEANRGDAGQEKIMRLAEQILSFSSSQMQAPDMPAIQVDEGLVDRSRSKLKQVYRGLPALERVYSEIKFRANSRFPAISIASLLDGQDREILAGSYALPGGFSREAWEGYVKDAITDASNNELQAVDWVLGLDAAASNIALQGSPEQLSKELQRVYKDDYAREWQKFLQGIVVQDFANMEQADTRLARLGDPFNSPLSKILNQTYYQTSWDNPSLAAQGLQGAQSGMMNWFKQTILRQAPSGITVPQPLTQKDVASGKLGYLGSQFASIAALVVQKSGAEGQDGTSLLKGYLDSLLKIRAKIKGIANTNNIGASSQALVAQTLDGTQGELVEAMKYTEDKMLNGLTGSSKYAMRPMLVRPIMQTFAVLLPIASNHINAQWDAQVVEPWERSVGKKYPFSPSATVEATDTEIKQFLGPEGAVAKFVDKTLTGVVNRTADTITPRTWADMGLIINRDFSNSLPRLLSAGGTASSAAPSGGVGEVKTVFQLQGVPTPGVTESTLTIDGQVMRYRNSQQEWVTFTWPVETLAPGVKLEVMGEAGESTVIFDYPGKFGLSRMMSSAQRTPLAGGVFSLSWAVNDKTASYNFRIVSGGDSGDSGAQSGGGGGGKGLRGLVMVKTVVSGVQTGAGNTNTPAASPTTNRSE